jgi:hypothetical protein
METALIDTLTDPKSLALVVSAAIIAVVVLGFMVRPIWQLLKSLALVVSAAIIAIVVLGFMARPIWQSWHERSRGRLFKRDSAEHADGQRYRSIALEAGTAGAARPASLARGQRCQFNRFVCL